MINRIFITILILILVPCILLSYTEKKEQSYKKEFSLLPYAFYNPSLSVCFGFNMGLDNYLGKYSSIKAGGIASVKKDLFGFLIARDIPLSKNKRLWFQPDIVFGKFSDLKSFQSGNPDFINSSRAGANDSDDNNYLSVDGTDIWIELTFRYLLPLAYGKDPEYEVKLEGGIPVRHRPLVWNPLKSGKLFLEFTWFYRNMSFTTDLSDTKEKNVTNGFKLSLVHENMDYRDNPSKGSKKKITYMRDPGVWGSSSEWSLIEGSWSKYLTVNKNRRGPGVLALNIWTSYCLSWNKLAVKGERAVYMRPPYFYGASLGGRFRLRAFEEGRYNDRAAVLYSAEYRKILIWNPLSGIEFFKKRNVWFHWIQFVMFCEAGRVNSRWDKDLLLKDLKWNLGLGLRTMMNRTLLRVDTGWSTKGFNVQMYIEHPF